MLQSLYNLMIEQEQKKEASMASVVLGGGSYVDRMPPLEQTIRLQDITSGGVGSPLYHPTWTTNSQAGGLAMPKAAMPRPSACAPFFTPPAEDCEKPPPLHLALLAFIKDGDGGNK
eukprot:Trichotokara_eunicae@DN3898_c0_g1_i1.p1